mgnify:FL=1
MCRFLAYMGAPVTVESLLIHPIYSLLTQTRAPRMQRHGDGNPDGFGVAWYDPDDATTPRRYRAAVPMWTDETFLGRANQISSSAILGHVRSATPGSAVTAENTHPFMADHWVFAHNGSVSDFSDDGGARLRSMITPRRLQGVEGSTDSEALFALTLDLLDTGAEPGEAMGNAIQAVCAISASPVHRLNLVLTDGERLAATAYGDTLFVLDHEGLTRDGVIVASEPFDDHPAWQMVPDGSVVEATRAGVAVRSLALSRNAT